MECFRDIDFFLIIMCNLSYTDDLNAHHNFGIAVRMLREELQLLQEPGSYVGEVVKVMGKSKVLVKVHLVSLLLLSCYACVHHVLL